MAEDLVIHALFAVRSNCFAGSIAEVPNCRLVVPGLRFYREGLMTRSAARDLLEDAAWPQLQILGNASAESCILQHA